MQLYYKPSIFGEHWTKLPYCGRQAQQLHHFQEKVFADVAIINNLKESGLSPEVMSKWCSSKDQKD